MHINMLTGSNIKECSSDILSADCARAGPSHSMKITLISYLSSAGQILLSNQTHSPLPEPPHPPPEPPADSSRPHPVWAHMAWLRMGDISAQPPPPLST